MAEQPNAEKPVDQSSKTQTKQLTRIEKFRDFFIGFAGWWIINSLFWLGVTLGFFSFSLGESGFFVTVYIVPFFFVAQVLSLIVLAFRRGWVSLGIISAIASNLAVSLLLGLIFNAVCFAPFFFPQ